MPLDQNPHQTVTRLGCIGFSMYTCGFSVPQMPQFCLLTYSPRSKWASSEKMIFFPKIGIFCKLHILQYYHDFKSNVAIFPSVVQAYTQLYSFGGRIKLIICQIRPELSVAIHEISTSWKKNVKWRTQYINVKIKAMTKAKYYLNKKSKKNWEKSQN